MVSPRRKIPENRNFQLSDIGHRISDSYEGAKDYVSDKLEDAKDSVQDFFDDKKEKVVGFLKCFRNFVAMDFCHQNNLCVPTPVIDIKDNLARSISILILIRCKSSFFPSKILFRSRNQRYTSGGSR